MRTLEQQPSAKCGRSTLVSVGVIVKCYTVLTHVFECVQLISLKIWVNVHPVNKTDDINSLARSHSYRIMNLAQST